MYFYTMLNNFFLNEKFSNFSASYVTKTLPQVYNLDSHLKITFKKEINSNL